MTSLVFVFRELGAHYWLVMGNEAYGQAVQAPESARTPSLSQAQQAFEQAVDLSPANDAAYAGLGATYRMLRKFDEAQAAYDRAVNLRPDNAILYADRAFLWLEKAHYVRPPDFRQLLATKPITEPPPMVATLLISAVVDYQAASDRDHGTAAYLMQAGTALYEQGEFSKSHESFAQAVWLDEENPDAYIGRGWASFRTGEQKKQEMEKRSYAERQVLSMAASVQYLLAWSDFDQANQLLKARIMAIRWDSAEYMSLNRQRANVLNGMAWTAIKLSAYDLAIMLFEEAGTVDPTNEEYHVSAGQRILAKETLYWRRRG